MTGARRAATCVAPIALALVLAGCGGGDRPPGESVPAMASTLDRVDAALADGEVDQARSELVTLVRVTGRARDAKKISETEAERVLAAVATLMTALPETAAPPPDRAPDPRTGTDDGNDKQGDDKDEDRDKEEDKDNDDGDGDGDGHNSESGPDDGHGD